MVEIIFRTGHYKGNIRKSARVQTNAQKNEMLQIQAQIIPEGDTALPLVIEPAVVLLDSIRPDDPENDWEFKIVLKNLSDKKVKVHLVAGPTELFKINIPSKDIKPGKERYIELEFEEDLIDELFTKSITIELNDSASTRYTIPVTKARRWGPVKRAGR